MEKFNLTAQALADKISNLALEKKGHQIAILNVQGLSSVTDFFVIISVDSEVQLKAIADHIERKLKTDENTHLYHKEGTSSPNWILLDYVDVVVHVFRKEVREHYGLERLWADAELKLVLEEEEV
jgi:ribosome-associated protein